MAKKHHIPDVLNRMLDLGSRDHHQVVCTEAAGRGGENKIKCCNETGTVGNGDKGTLPTGGANGEQQRKVDEQLDRLQW